MRTQASTDARLTTTSVAVVARSPPPPSAAPSRGGVEATKACTAVVAPARGAQSTAAPCTGHRRGAGGAAATHAHPSRTSRTTWRPVAPSGTCVGTAAGRPPPPNSSSRARIQARSSFWCGNSPSRSRGIWLGQRAEHGAARGTDAACHQ